MLNSHPPARGTVTNSPQLSPGTYCRPPAPPSAGAVVPSFTAVKGTEVCNPMLANIKIETPEKEKASEASDVKLISEPDGKGQDCVESDNSSDDGNLIIIGEDDNEEHPTACENDDHTMALRLQEEMDKDNMLQRQHTEEMDRIVAENINNMELSQNRAIGSAQIDDSTQLSPEIINQQAEILRNIQLNQSDPATSQRQQQRVNDSRAERQRESKNSDCALS